MEIPSAMAGFVFIDKYINLNKFNEHDKYLKISNIFAGGIRFNY